MAFDHIRRGGPPPFSAACDPRVLDGVALPPALFADDAALRSGYFCSDPVEEAFFTPLPVDDVVRICARFAPEAAPRRRVLTDRYVDTPDRALFRQGVSARVREYHVNSRPVRFEVIVLSLLRPAPAARPQARVNRVLVQTFVRNGAEEMEALLERHARAGLVEVARVDKTRVAFDLLPVITEDERGMAFSGADARLLEELPRLHVVDLGIKLVADEIRGAPFAEPTIVEVEYDGTRVAQGAALAERLRVALGPGARRKAHNKIAYLLAGDPPPPEGPDQEEGKG